MKINSGSTLCYPIKTKHATCEQASSVGLIQVIEQGLGIIVSYVTILMFIP